MRAIHRSTELPTAARVIASAGLSAVLLFAAACGNDAPSAATPASSVAETTQAQPAAALSPEQLGQVGAEIRREPARADEILAKHRLTRESFEAAIRGVTEDAEASRRYAAAYRGAPSS